MTTSESLNKRRKNLLSNEVSNNKENIQLIWLDGNINDSDDYLLTQLMLIELNSAVQFYSHFDRCLDLIKSIKNEQISLIVSGECFLYKLLNKALRTEDIELLSTFRFFIIDLCSVIKQENHRLKNKGTLILYRGTQIPKEELEKIKENIDKTISTNGFLSTSRNINVSLRFIHNNPPLNDFTSVLFEIKANPLLKTVIFADVGNKFVVYLINITQNKIRN
ncbi:unnamed protein product [Adineta steineri]|uniref:Uncharacterized protein n=1 Tax=Adineta steineri TaxID=433720 RepID=A0A814BL90_9BILA|nr:unnamed protein product [Adineta steineri]CAF0928141.1 unnamed protein product [Adineta steineri]